ncbi:TPA: hypothetical protein ACH3X1_003238 [Trebouxia sp. C0004]
MVAAQMLTQGFNNCTNLQDRDSATVKRDGLPNRLQTSSYGARKVLSTILNRKSTIKIVKQDCVEKRPNRTSSYLVPKLKCLLPPKTCNGDNPNSSSNMCSHHFFRQSLLPSLQRVVCASVRGRAGKKYFFFCAWSRLVAVQMAGLATGPLALSIFSV